jgi:hypothetical protein
MVFPNYFDWSIFQMNSESQQRMSLGLKMFSHARRAQQLMHSFGGAGIVLSEHLEQFTRHFRVASQKRSSQGVQFGSTIRTPGPSMGK